MSNSSNDNSTPAELKVGNYLTGIVHRILSDRILLRLPGGIHGIIRQREMSWDDAHPNPASLVQLQKPVKAVVIKIDAEQKSAELSLRFAQRDPWQDLSKRYRVRDVVDGIVQDVRDFGAFVAIEPGVEGLIRVSETRLDSQIEEAQEALWIGDHVRTVITDINVPQRHLALSIKEYLQYHHYPEKLSQGERGQLRLADRLSPAVLHKLRQALGDLPEAVDRPEPGRIQTILVVDDYPEFRQSLVQLLRGWRYVVDEAGNEEETHAYVEQKRYDLIILDFYLGRGATLALAKEIRAIHPGVEILLLSGAEVTENDKQQATAQRVMFDYKPYGADHLATLLHQLETGVATLTTLQSSALYQLSPARLPLVPDTDVSRMLQTLMDQTSAKGAALFALDETKSGEIKWLYHCGVKITSTRDVHTMLLYSPVGDVIREQQRVIIRNTADRPEQSKYLQQAISFRSCIGVPVYIFSQYRPYALFIFSDKPAAFSEQDYDILQRTAEALGVLLFRQRVFNVFLERQEELVQSHVRAGVLHDIRNILGSLDFKLPRLTDHVGELQGHLDSAASSEALHKDIEAIRLLTAEVQAAARQIAQTAKLEQELGGSERIGPMDVNAIVRSIVERYMPFAKKLSATLDFEPAPTLPSTTLNLTHLHQAVDNVILNALQWCAERQVRLVQVTTGTEGGDPLLPVKIRITDTGPGIHQQLQSHHIYELGFSRRAGGSGMGLFVARMLLESMGAKIAVEQSIIEVGTTFLIELPVHQSTTGTERI